MNFSGEASFRNENLKSLIRIERGEFQVCQPVQREKRDWFGLRTKLVFVHRTADDRWDIEIV